MAYGTKTSSIMDIPMSVSSVVAPYIGDNGYAFEGVNSVRVLSIANGSLATYDESEAVDPFGAPSLVVPAEQVLTLAYNKSMLLRVQKTQMQDIPVSAFSKKVALQQADEVFVPAHDVYSLAKIYASIPSGNKVTAVATSSRKDRNLKAAVDKCRTNGSSMQSLVAWLTYSLSSEIQDAINYTGSEAGFTAGKNGYLGRIAGVPCVEIPDAYMFPGVLAIVADKKAIVNVTPKMDPKNGGLEVLDKVPGFSGIEIQMRDRSDTFVLNKKARNTASLEIPGSTTTTTTA